MPSRIQSRATALPARSVAVVLAAALLACVAVAAVSAPSARADSRGHGRSTDGSKNDGARPAEPRISRAKALTHRHKREHHRKAKQPQPTPAPAPVVAPAPTPVPAPALDVQSLPTRATISTAHPFEGSGAGRFEVREGDVEPQTGGQRSEVSGPVFNAGQNIYVRDEIRVPYGYSFGGPWQLIDQLHETEWSGSPGMATFLEPNRQIRVGAGDGDPTYWQGPALEFERWYTLVYRVNLSEEPTQGYVEVWLNGVPQLLTNGATRMYGQTIQTGHTYINAGIFRSQEATGTSIVEHDDVGVATSLAAVMSF